MLSSHTPTPPPVLYSVSCVRDSCVFLADSTRIKDISVFTHSLHLIVDGPMRWYIHAVRAPRRLPNMSGAREGLFMSRDNFGILVLFVPPPLLRWFFKVPVCPPFLPPFHGTKFPTDRGRQCSWLLLLLLLSLFSSHQQTFRPSALASCGTQYCNGNDSTMPASAASAAASTTASALVGLSVRPMPLS